MRVERSGTLDAGLQRLSHAKLGDQGVIVEIRRKEAGSGQSVDADEMERRLLEFGFVEGAHLELIHEGAIRRDPIAVRLDDMRVALRRHDAHDVIFKLDQPV